MDWVLPLLGGLGIGSMVTTLLNHYFTRRAQKSDRLQVEMREAYIGLLGSLHAAAVEPTDANQKAFALWQIRCQLFGSSEVAKFAQSIIDTNDGPRSARTVALDGLIAAMRADLRR